MCRLVDVKRLTFYLFKVISEHGKILFSQSIYTLSLDLFSSNTSLKQLLGNGFGVTLNQVSKANVRIVADLNQNPVLNHKLLWF